MDKSGAGTVHAKLASHIAHESKVVIDSANRLNPDRTTTSNFTISLGDGFKDVVGIQVVSLVMPNPLTTVSEFNDKFVMRSGFGSRRPGNEVTLKLERKNYSPQDVIDVTRGDTSDMANNTYNIATLSYPYGIRIAATISSDIIQAELNFVTMMSLFPFIVDAKTSTACKLFGYNGTATRDINPLDKDYDWSGQGLATAPVYLESRWQRRTVNSAIGNSGLFGSFGVVSKVSGKGVYLESGATALKGISKTLGTMSEYNEATIYTHCISPRRYNTPSQQTTFRVNVKRSSLTAPYGTMSFTAGSSFYPTRWYNTHYGNTILTSGALYPLNEAPPYTEPVRRVYVTAGDEVAEPNYFDSAVTATLTSGYAVDCTSANGYPTKVAAWTSMWDGALESSAIVPPNYGGGWLVTDSVYRAGGPTACLTLMNVHSMPTTRRRDNPYSGNAKWPTSMSVATTGRFSFTMDIAPNTFLLDTSLTSSKANVTPKYDGSDTFTSTLFNNVPYGQLPTASATGSLGSFFHMPRHQVKTGLPPGSCVVMDAVTIDVSSTSPIVAALLPSTSAARVPLENTRWAIYDESTTISGAVPTCYYDVDADQRVVYEERVYRNPETMDLMRVVRTQYAERHVVEYREMDVLEHLETRTTVDDGAASITTTVSNAHRHVFFRNEIGLFIAKVPATEAFSPTLFTRLANRETIAGATVVLLDGHEGAVGRFEAVGKPAGLDITAVFGRTSLTLPNGATPITVNPLKFRDYTHVCGPTAAALTTPAEGATEYIPLNPPATFTIFVTQGYILKGGTTHVICEHVRPINTANAASATNTTVSAASAALSDGVTRDAYYVIYTSPWKTITIDRWKGVETAHPSTVATTVSNSVTTIKVYSLYATEMVVHTNTVDVGRHVANMGGMTSATVAGTNSSNYYCRTGYPKCIMKTEQGDVGNKSPLSFYRGSDTSTTWTGCSGGPFKSIASSAHDTTVIPLSTSSLLANGICALVKERWVTVPGGFTITLPPARAPDGVGDVVDNPYRYYLDLVGSDGVSNVLASSAVDMIGYIDWQLGWHRNVDIETTGSGVGLPKVKTTTDTVNRRDISNTITYWDQCTQFHEQVYSPIHAYEAAVKSVRRVRVVIDSSESQYAISYPCIQTSSSHSFGERHELTSVSSNLLYSLANGTSLYDTDVITTVTATPSTGIVYGYPRCECHFTVWPATERGTARLQTLSPTLADIRTTYYGDESMLEEYGCNAYLPVFGGKTTYLTQSPQYINMVPTKRLVLRCPELESLIDFNNFDTPSIAGIAMFAVNAPARIYNSAEGSSIFLAGGRNFHPISSLDKLTLRVENENSETIDMKGLDYYFILQVTHLVPDNNRLYLTEFNTYASDAAAIDDSRLDEVYNARKRGGCTANGGCSKGTIQLELSNEKAYALKFEDALNLVFTPEFRGSTTKPLPILKNPQAVAPPKPFRPTELLSRIIPDVSKYFPSPDATK